MNEWIESQTLQILPLGVDGGTQLAQILLKVILFPLKKV